jgi:hypothetical protein
MATGTRWCGQIVANHVGKETRFRYHFGTEVRTTSTSRNAYFVWWSFELGVEAAVGTFSREYFHNVVFGREKSSLTSA